MTGFERIVSVSIYGRVQRVGYRVWIEAQARRHALSGWVRNRRDGSVEAVLAGSAAAIGTMLIACHQGPAKAAVTGVDSQDVDSSAVDFAAGTFEVRDTF